jgi:DNA-binding response OmpR family regulator
MSSPCRILYVDDNKDSCELVKAMLHFSDLNYEMVTIESAKEALSLMENQSFDLFILDYSLPDISGIELCRYIKMNDPIKPVMFLSARAYPADRAEGLKAGADEYLVKPNDLGKLVETINQLLDKNPLANCETPNNVQIHSGIH